ncbi:MAG: thermonuclease family protein [Xanthobacteraceae bacterium]
MLAAGVVMFGAPPVRAADAIIGQASVIDGDTLEIHGERIRLEGIDAPESRQTCQLRAGGATVRCGQQAALFLADLIGRKTVTCAPNGRDRYRRVLAHCSISEGDLGGLLVRAGWALSFVRYSREYEADEDLARAAEDGLWSMTFVPPWEWRASGRPPTR